MGIIKAVMGAIGGGLADSWLEVLEPDNMGDTTVFTRGVKVRKDDSRNQNKKGTDDTVSDGSVIHVYKDQFMILVDGGKIVDYTAEEGYYTVSNSSMPSLMNGQFMDTLKESFNRVRYGGVPSSSQKVYYINLQEIKGIKFGTRNPINYFDEFYNSELFIRAHGMYSIKITNPILFYAEAIPKNKDRVDINDINEQYLAEFLEALQTSLNRFSVDGVRISHVTSKARELGKYMADTLDDDWRRMRGMEIQSVGIASISYDEESTKLINMRNQGAMLGDPTVREGYVQGSVARGMEAAGSNSAGTAAAFMGMGVGMQAGGGFVGAASASNQAQMAQQQANQQQQPQQQAQTNSGATGTWACSCGADNEGKFCVKCGAKRPTEQDGGAAGAWTCSCGKVNNGKFCSECGAKKPETSPHCSKCGYEPKGGEKPKFCPECGTQFQW